MADFKIKKEHHKTVIGFNNSGLPLGERDDLDVLARIAQESQNPALLNLFEGKLPTVAQLKKSETDKQLHAVGAKTPSKRVRPSKAKIKTSQASSDNKEGIANPMSQNPGAAGSTEAELTT